MYTRALLYLCSTEIHFPRVFCGVFKCLLMFLWLFLWFFSVLFGSEYVFLVKLFVLVWLFFIFFCYVLLGFSLF